MVHQTEHEEKIIDQVLALLQEKHNKVPVEQYCHYVVEGDNENECDSEDYCEDCIQKGIRKHVDMWWQKRSKEINFVKQLKSVGYIIHKAWNSDRESMAIQMHTPTKKEASKYIKDIVKKYKEEPNPIFSYRYYSKDSDHTTRSCDNCGKYIQVCVTADEQEIEHWESFDDIDFLPATMSDDMAYQLYELFQFIHQAEDGVYKRGVLIIEKILLVNNICETTDRAPNDERSVATGAESETTQLSTKKSKTQWQKQTNTVQLTPHIPSVSSQAVQTRSAEPQAC